MTKTKLRRRPETEKTVEKVFHAISNRRIGHTVCFLCGKKLNNSNRSAEHVIPAWVQDRFNLWDQELILLNGTTIPYRQLTIPCCVTCNTLHLSRIENSVRAAVDDGARALKAVDKTALLIWLSKIMYGLLYREHLLYFDRKSPLKGRLVRRTFLQRIRTFYLFMQAARIQMDFVQFFPASIFVFDIQVPDDKRAQFDFTDHPLFLTIACRLGSVGIIAALQDGGAQSIIFRKYMDKFKNMHLHPLQFSELIAKVFYKASLFNRTPKYITVQAEDKLLVNQLPLQGLSTKPIFDDWNMHAYARLLSIRTGYPLDQIFEPPDKVWTWLQDSQGNVPSMDIKKDEWELRERTDVQQILARKARRFLKWS
jgi:hypothetical protein